MNNGEYVSFLKSVLIKIENAINLIEQKTPKHIPAYHKILGVQQKLGSLHKSYKNELFSQLINVRGIINYLTNGNYKDAHFRILQLKKDLINICCEIENEKNTIKKI